MQDHLRKVYALSPWSVMHNASYCSEIGRHGGGTPRVRDKTWFQKQSLCAFAMTQQIENAPSAFIRLISLVGRDRIEAIQ
jgi:hypothetical protein